MKEQIIEFPILPKDMFDGPLDPNEGFCISYQYDVDTYGYGPYGFRTKKASRLLKEMFPSIVYWDVSRMKLVGAEVPLGAGIYFFKNQKYIHEVEAALRDYEKAHKLWGLRSRYKKIEEIGSAPVKPSLLNVSNRQILSADVINELLQEKCKFFILYSLIPYAGQSLALFDKALSVRFRMLAARESVPYQVMNSADELKPW
ncbi:MAG: hypothetical protein ACRER8_16475 [Pseudomonas sp.]|uniref:hypothetical protein n=1 Tax=Pseudomonas sp. TaxID=306 RepID=UPI003D6FBCF7